MVNRESSNFTFFGHYFASKVQNLSLISVDFSRNLLYEMPILFEVAIFRSGDRQSVSTVRVISFITES